MRGRDPLAGDAVRRWRDAIRVWACHVYSYSVPNEAALSTLARFAPLVEIGAGTGYWAALLKNRGVDIRAYDCDPPLPTDAGDDVVMGSVGGSEGANEYHGCCRAWTTVERGGPKVMARHPDAALLLCYPPPGSPMALDALRAFRGHTVCLIGEWHGDTGTVDFERALARDFALLEAVPLPNWGDSAARLTVWRRHSGGARTVGQASPLSCWGCGTTGDAKLWRCRLTYEAAFCSERCASKPEAQARHRAQLALRFAVLPPASSTAPAPLPRFGDARHFRRVDAAA